MPTDDERKATEVANPTAPLSDADEGEVFDVSDEDLAAAIESFESGTPARRRREKAEPPDVGGDGGEWRLADGRRLDGNVTRVRGAKVYAIHVSNCTRCGGQGGSSHWPGHTCFKCGGARVDRREVRLYAPADVEALAAARALKHDRKTAERLARDAALAARREEDRLHRVENFVRPFKSLHPALFEGAARCNLAAKDPIAANMMHSLEHEGWELSPDQIGYLQDILDRVRERERGQLESKWVAAASNRVESTAVCTRIFTQNFRRAGMNWVGAPTDLVVNHLMRDDAGNVLRLKATNKDLGFEVGDRVQFVGTVKSHDSFDGVRQTVLNRVKVKDVVRKADLESIVAASKAALEEPEAPSTPSP